MNNNHFEILEGTPEYKAMKALEDSVNSTSWNEKRFAACLRTMHRTLQQTAIRSFIACIIEAAKDDFGTDLRNEASADLCKKIVDSGVLEEVYLPFV